MLRHNAPMIVSLLLLAACADPADAPSATPDATSDATPGAAPTEIAAQAAPTPDRAPAAPAASLPLKIYDTRVVRTLPHDRAAFTQGLFFADGRLYESTGQRGESVIRRIDMRDGSAAQETKLPDAIFGEGSTVVGDRVVSLSWRAGQGFVFDLETLTQQATFDIEGEGWGLAHDTNRGRLVLSDGTPRLRFLDPETYAPVGEMTVTLNGRALPRLNELEYVPANGGEVWANVWQQDFIVRIDADTGRVTGVIDVSQLIPVADRADPRDDVPNGIAYEAGSGRIFLTGKRWPTLFEVELVERAP